MLTDNELRRLALLIVQEQARNPEWMESYAKARAKAENPSVRLVSAKRAAEILGISVWQLYKIKDDENGEPQFSYVKGVSQSSPLKFNVDKLEKEYERYLSSRKVAANAIPLRAVV